MDLAEQFGLQLQGDAEFMVQGVCSLNPGADDCIGFVLPAYLDALDGCRAGALVIHPDNAHDWTGNALLSLNPHADYARIAGLFDPSRMPAYSGRAASAEIDPTAKIEADVNIAPGAIIGPGSHIHSGSYIGPGCVLGKGVVIGQDCHLVSRISIGDGVALGDRVRIQPGAVIGGRGFGLVKTNDGWIDVPQLGAVRIGNDVEIGANTCIDRGAIDDTVLEDGVKVDNLVQIGHNCVIGTQTVIAGCVGIAGSSRIGAHCQIAGGVGISDHVSIADKTVITARSVVTSSLKESGVYSSTLPVAPVQEWRKQIARLRRLDDWVRRILKLEQGKQDD